ADDSRRCCDELTRHVCAKRSVLFDRCGLECSSGWRMPAFAIPTWIENATRSGSTSIRRLRLSGSRRAMECPSLNSSVALLRRGSNRAGDRFLVARTHGNVRANEESMPFVAEQHFIIATRETGYRTSSSALAELVDNAVQAGARVVQIRTNNFERSV